MMIELCLLDQFDLSPLWIITAVKSSYESFIMEYWLQTYLYQPTFVEVYNTDFYF